MLERNIIDSVLKTNPWTYQIKDLNREKIIGSGKELLLSILWMSYYPEQDSHIGDKFIVGLDLIYLLKKISLTWKLKLTN